MHLKIVKYDVKIYIQKVAKYAILYITSIKYILKNKTPFYSNNSNKLLKFLSETKILE